MKKIISWGISLALIAASGISGSAAYADSSSKAIQIVQSIAPDLLATGSENQNLTVTRAKNAFGSDEVRLYSKEAGGNRSLSLSIDYATNVAASLNGAVVLDSEDANVKAVAQETGNGFRVLTVISDMSKSRRFNYTMNLPAGARLVKAGANYLLESGSTVLGSIAEPWALDSQGRNLKTHFEWHESVLTQVLDEDLANIAYPVVMDPAWGYTYQYDLSFRASTNMSRLKTCFNCYFPVAGAPRAYPKLGQLLPLSVAVFNFECTMGSTIQTTDYGSFQFNATRNHVDGFGSNIIFQFIQIGSKNFLVVDAYIVNSLDLIRAPYMAAAGLNWQIFAWNLNSPTPRT
jgi:hypothetical protein